MFHLKPMWWHEAFTTKNVFEGNISGYPSWTAHRWDTLFSRCLCFSENVRAISSDLPMWSLFTIAAAYCSAPDQCLSCNVTGGTTAGFSFLWDPLLCIIVDCYNSWCETHMLLMLFLLFPCFLKFQTIQPCAQTVSTILSSFHDYNSHM